MKLDPRIILQTDILTPFDEERAEQFIGQKGFFANDIQCFENLYGCRYGVLVNAFADDSNDHYYNPYQHQDEDLFYPYFIPESSLKPEEKKPDEKKYRPYTPEEFCDKFQVGQPVKFRKKDDGESEQDLILHGLWYERRDGKTIAYGRLGSHLYALDELFNDFEWRALFKKDFEPFGVEE